MMYYTKIQGVSVEMLAKYATPPKPEIGSFSVRAVGDLKVGMIISCEINGDHCQQPISRIDLAEDGTATIFLGRRIDD